MARQHQSHTHPDPAIGELAARQHGVASRRQLDALGVTAAMLRTRIGSGRLVRLHRGVYAVGHRCLRAEGFSLAATLAVPRSALSHRASAALHGVRQSNAATIDVTTTGCAGNTRNIRVHRVRRLDPADRTTVEGIPCTTVARTLVDLASILPADSVAKAIREAERLRLLDVRALEAAAGRVRGRRGPGHAVLRQALDEQRALGTSLTRSELELAFLRLVAEAGLPAAHMNAWLEDDEVDALWRDQRLIVELDSWGFHRTRSAFQRDRTKATNLTIAGYRVLRYTHDDVVRRPAQVAAGLRMALEPEAPGRPA